MRVAFLGLGIMGGAMAANLVKAGHEVTTWITRQGKISKGRVVRRLPRMQLAAPKSYGCAFPIRKPWKTYCLGHKA